MENENKQKLFHIPNISNQLNQINPEINLINGQFFMGNTKVNPQANWFYAPVNQMNLYRQQMMSQLQYTQQQQMFYSQFYANYGQFPQQFYYSLVYPQSNNL
jgi:hypothetical protein